VSREPWSRERAGRGTLINRYSGRFTAHAMSAGLSLGCKWLGLGFAFGCLSLAACCLSPHTQSLFAVGCS
jgi:hypothetical protein